MQLVRSRSNELMAVVGWSARCLLVAPDSPVGLIGHRLTSLGAQVEYAADPYTALQIVTEDPADYDLLVLDCDAMGGLDLGRRVAQLMGDTILRVPVVLISSECKTQVFAQERRFPTVMRAPLSAVSMRVGLGHVLRDRLLI